MLTSRRPLRSGVLLTVLALAWIVLDALCIPPGFGNTDIYYFKDAALNFAQGQGLVTRFTFGNPQFVYRDFSMYPPLYPALFGVWARLTGVSLWSSQLFNTCISVATGMLVYVALRRVVRAEGQAAGLGGVLVFLCAASLITGFFAPAADRPDALGVMWGVGAILLSTAVGSRWRAVLAGVLCALALFTSPFAGLWTSLAIAACILGTSVGSAAALKAACGRLLLLGLGGVGTGLLVLGALNVLLPGWFDGFFGVATGSKTNNETGGGYFLSLLHGDVRTWLHAFPFDLPSFYLGLAKLVAVQLALLGWILLNGAGRGPVWRLAPLLLCSPLCLLTSPYQSNYLPMTAALALAAWGAFAPSVRGEASYPAASFITAAFAAVVMLGLPFVARDEIIRCSAGPSIDRAITYIAAHRSELAAADTLIVVSPTIYMLWRQEGLHPLISAYSGFNDGANRAHVKYVALSYPGSGDALRPQWPPWLDNREYFPVSSPALPQLAAVLGLRASRSSQTWESEVLQRRAPSPAGGRR
jgi:hypothetical protein